MAAALDVLRSEPGDSVPMLVFQGIGGIGKSSLLERIRRSFCLPDEPFEADKYPHTSIPHAWLDFSSAASARESGIRTTPDMLHYIKRELARYGMQFRAFELVWARRWEMQSGGRLEPSVSRADFGNLLEAAKAVGGTLGSVVGLTELLAKQGVKWYTEWTEGPLAPDGFENWLHAEDALPALAPAIAQDIIWNIERRRDAYESRWPVLFFDSLEWLLMPDAKATSTLHDLLQLAEHLPLVPFVAASRQSVPDFATQGIAREIRHVSLDMIPEPECMKYLLSRGIRKGSWGAIWAATGGHALWMGIAADIAETRAEQDLTVTDLRQAGDKIQSLLRRLLEELADDHLLRELVYAACVCRWFDRGLLRSTANLPPDFVSLFRGLCDLSIVIPTGGRRLAADGTFHVHETIRRLALDWLRDQDELTWMAERAADHCASMSDETGAWRIEETYFRSVASRETLLPSLEELHTLVDRGLRRHVSAHLEAVQEALWVQAVDSAEAHSAEYLYWLANSSWPTPDADLSRALQRGLDMIAAGDSTISPCWLTLAQASLPQFEKAKLELLHEALDQAQSRAEPVCEARALRALAWTHVAENEHLNNPETLRRALELFENSGDNSSAFLVRCDIARAYLDGEPSRPREAAEAARNALESAPFKGNEHAHGRLYHTLGRSLMAIEEWTAAAEALQAALEVFEDDIVADPKGVAAVQRRLSRLIRLRDGLCNDVSRELISEALETDRRLMSDEGAYLCLCEQVRQLVGFNDAAARIALQAARRLYDEHKFDHPEGMDDYNKTCLSEALDPQRMM